MVQNILTAEDLQRGLSNLNVRQEAWDLNWLRKKINRLSDRELNK